MMDQPKFKFGDSLIRTKEFYKDDRITVNIIKKDKCGKFWYGENDAVKYGETSLELYQEPQNKKLYAYKSVQGHVVFSESEIHGPQINGYGTQRDPHYDLDYGLGYPCTEKPL